MAEKVVRELYDLTSRRNPFACRGRAEANAQAHAVAIKLLYFTVGSCRACAGPPWRYTLSHASCPQAVECPFRGRAPSSSALFATVAAEATIYSAPSRGGG